ncbi:MAG: hypothetical protein KKC30_15740 [Proteobacteria bacterium]|nr:hypothetical protein [Pseudomonadota bacterium]MBU4381585.1 hypothetical protein [Pseudomonadota bacterium]MCG2766571.1 hypothetical protein [Desulfarculaceae bacterium]
MTENHTQNLIPRKLSYRALVRSGWAGFTRANIVNAFQLGGGVSGAIAACESKILGLKAEFSHSMLYLGRGQLLDQQSKLEVRSLENYVGYILRCYRNPRYSQAQLNTIVAESMVWHGTGYDFRIIGAHAAETMLGTDGLAERLHDPDRFDCSEGVCTFVRYGDLDFMDGRPCQVMPEEIDEWCIKAGWRISTYALVE